MVSLNSHQRRKGNEDGDDFRSGRNSDKKIGGLSKKTGMTLVRRYVGTLKRYPFGMRINP